MAVSEINHKSVRLFSFAARFCGLERKENVNKNVDKNVEAVKQNVDKNAKERTKNVDKNIGSKTKP
jgi:hypothetical protein